jgi:hypothetical protein
VRVKLRSPPTNKPSSPPTKVCLIIIEVEFNPIKLV